MSDDSHSSWLNSSQLIVVPQFHGDSYITVPLSRPASRALSFEIWFLTYEPNGNKGMPCIMLFDIRNI